MSRKLLNLLSHLTVLGSFGQPGAAAPSSSTNQACEELSTTLADRVSYPLSLSYHSETTAYWSTILRELKPACVVLPESAEEVSKAVTILNKYPDVKFTAKSGGHDPNAGHATAQDGVLISLEKMSGATYDSSTNLASVKPGGEWNDVISSLNEHGVTIVGGRLGIVGVGGYLVQGGISFLSAQYGLAADNIVGWEIVAADGTIINVDANTQSELATALRGSGSQFGIVTKFTIKAHPIGKVWGGIRIYDASQTDKIFKTLHDFVPGSNNDTKAAIIVTNISAVASLNAFLIFYFYDGENPPTEGPFADFLTIPSLVSITGTQTYPELASTMTMNAVFISNVFQLKSNGVGASLINSRISFRTLTIPYVPEYPAMYSEISKKMTELSSDYFNNPLHLVSQCSVDFQPLPAAVGRQSEQNGGNAMGLTASDPDRVLLEFQCAWASKDDDDTLVSITRDLTAWIEARIPVWLEASSEAKDVYLPLFMNDAMADQNVTGSYRDYAKFKALQQEYDPIGTLRERTGGFKY
ncbi:unnamed protein product [Clonostachys rosea]|uniref:FAD-binding PCMH-type domain-containing protein n=1 Tax=Bionectria ochroleuca TaxID=29856 RepID=A0ABY6TZW4_BIOOC|nr:unnamed protein product [Clonostachys rosea]